MKFLARLAAGDVALWLAFWLVGTPLALIWDATGGCMVVGCGIGEPWAVTSIIALFTVSCLGVMFVSFAIWRSATNYPRTAWWHWLVAIAAKLCAAFSAFAATLSFLAVLYFLVSFLFPGVMPF